MSLQLSLLPFGGYKGQANFSHAIIPCDDDEWDFDIVNKVTQLDVDNGFNSYCSRNGDFDEPHYGETLETPYGEPLTYTKAKFLKGLFKGPAGAYVDALDPDHKIALYWH